MLVTKKIKILECIRQGQIGGGESHLLSLVENLNRSAFEPVVLSFTEGPMIERLKQMNVESHVIFTDKPFDFRKWKQVKRLIREHQIDIVHAHGSRANSNILWAARSLGIPVVYTVHGWSFHQDQNPVAHKIRVFSEKYLTSKTDLNISVSFSNQQSGKKYIKSFNSIVINNGIDQNKFNPEKCYKNIRKELNIPVDEILVLFIARFTAHKQPLSLINAFAKTLMANPKLHLLMVGEGDQKQMAKELIDSHGLNHKITLHSFRQDVPDVLANADIFVLPSLWEGLPIGLLEAMAMGKAVIASNVDGTSEIIVDNLNGLLVNTNNLSEELTTALLKLSDDASLRRQFGQKAIETINDKFNAANMTRLIEYEYNRLAKHLPSGMK
ncbi:MAG: glycosyltransferase family 4 protein [Chitinophagaceae bacterium]